MPKVLKIMDQTGHTTIEITPETAADAKATFERLLGQGHRAFRMREGGKDTPINKFSQIGEETLIIPRLVGG